MYANKEKIQWLLTKSGESIAELSKRSGVAKMTISDLKHGKSSIDRMRFDNAYLLTKLAEKLMAEESDEKS
ncbi:hypothetical protein [Enterococcus sp. 1001283B150225_161107_E12]|uniref:hypothetical protein n=1 Tax=Enterococcus sp. 1001283B150225_161107_E12 TaxID=2787145 RepID=UPI0018A0405E|nr:hypothetical protein [Enterococcus sp. 1001283B150225_161107_E12]